ncbi:L-fuculose phosphate aldolase [Variibacter gotjawalensis]|uniref:3-oxo-tetronate 4-phosphate decarboxylase n=1 Tax=Variibacter gotjawalensis TaxID=1333996 RepID=A0A0S3PXL4_9BRAD|nr:aldolase [Variibacter gotjawalensis]NIK46515.1 ribulose-5-phosphate 4-epimerase/fuculose-1-phosphate aldolase [Variibacter gotjawalensis]RZS48423.1 ribulose-5-phosphate 4-epimerase/fuculose-1-phosphate aldolase [Variibacter gotjawalensis]BAT60682.1 L-fuculose phosphate aldolase [Variibacter gotjawalensis]
MSEQAVRDALVKWGRSLFERGLTAGSSGNISVKLDDGFLVTPTNSCLGFLEASRISKLAPDGKHVSGAAPTKELPLHFAFYEARPQAKAVVHLHSTYATLLSCLADADPNDAIPPITPYVVMRVGRVPIVPYTKPGSPEVAPYIRDKAPEHAAILLGNHGPVVAGPSLEAAVFAAEELEETAKLVILARGLNVRHLPAEAIADLNASFKLK